MFNVSDVPVGDAQVVVSSADYSTGYKTVEITTDETTHVALDLVAWSYLWLSSTEVSDGTTVDLTEWDSLTGSYVSTFSITFPAAAITDATGAAYTEAVYLKLAMLNEPSELPASPGEMMAVDTTDPTEEVALESFGMFEAQLETTEGEPLTLASTVEVSFLTYGEHTEGDTIGLYSFDETTGLWVNEGSGTIDASGWFHASIPHFSWWNCDQPVSNTSCISGIAEDSEGNPLTSGSVRSVGIDYIGGSYGSIAADGTFCVEAKPESNNEVRIQGANDSGLFAGQGESMSGLAGEVCGGDGCVDVGTIVASKIDGGCVTGRVTGDMDRLDELDFHYTVYSPEDYTSGYLTLNDDYTFCLDVALSAETVQVFVGEGEGAWGEIEGGGYWSCYGRISTSLTDSSFDDLVESTCGEGDCTDIGDLSIDCEEYGDGSDGGDEGEIGIPLDTGGLIFGLDTGS
jgi:hypothetical protein